MGKKYTPSLAGKLAGTVQRAFDPYSRGSNRCYPLGKRPAGACFISSVEDIYKYLAEVYNAKPQSKSGHPLLYIAFLVYLILFLPVVMCFRDSLLGGVYILVALGSYYQLEGKGRIVFVSVLGCFFYWWCLSRALWGPNNDILNILEALQCRGLVQLLKRVSVRRGNPFTGLVTRTNYVNTIKRSVGFNCSERWNLNMDHSALKTDKDVFPRLRVRVLFEEDVTAKSDLFEGEFGMITVESRDEVLTDYGQLRIFERIRNYFTFLSYNPDNLTCSETIGNEMGIPCAHALSLREIMDHFMESSEIFQMKFDKEILVK